MPDSSRSPSAAPEAKLSLRRNPLSLRQAKKTEISSLDFPDSVVAGIRDIEVRAVRRDARRPIKPHRSPRAVGRAK